MKTLIDLLHITHRTWGETFMHGKTAIGLSMVDIADDMIYEGRC